MKKTATRGRRILVATALSAGGLAIFAPVAAHAAFTDCASGNVCIWTGSGYSGTKTPYTGSAGGQDPNDLNKSSLSFGNRRSTGTARFYNWEYGGVGPGWQQTLLGTAAPATGNSFPSTKIVDQINVS